ncbi:hypothetical protein BHE74_00056603, partial [Ensete ventricosum]
QFTLDSTDHRCLVSVLGVCLCILHLLIPFHDQALSLHESKGSTTQWKSRLCVTMANAYGPIIDRLASASLSSQSVDPPLRRCDTLTSPPLF